MIPLLLALACNTPAPPTPAPPPLAPPTPELRAAANGPCWVMPLPVVVGLQLGPDGRALVTSMDKDAGRDRHQSWWVALETGQMEPLGETLGPLPKVLSDGSVLLSRPEALDAGTPLETVRVGQRPESLTRLVRLSEGQEQPLSAPGHDVTSFIVREADGELLYVAGRQLWRAPLTGGAPEPIADEILDLHDVLDDGRWLVNTVDDNKLVLGIRAPDGATQALGESVALAMAREGELWAQSHPAAPLRRGPLKGPVDALSPREARRLLPSGAEATVEPGGVRLQFIGEDGEGLLIEGASGLRDAYRQGDQVIALVVHNTLRQAAVTPLSEADLCALPGAGTTAAPSRDVPYRYVARFADLEGLSAALQAKVEGYRVLGVDGLVELTLDGPGPARPPSLKALVDRAQAAMPAPSPDVLLRFPDSGRFGLVMTRAGYTLHRSGYERVTLVADPKEVPLHVEGFGQVDGHCQGTVRNHSEDTLQFVAECVPQGGGWGYLGAPPTNTRVTLTLAPKESAEVKVRAPFTDRVHTLRFNADGLYLPSLRAEDALAARQLQASLLDLSERRALRVEPDDGGVLSFSPFDGPWATERLPGVYAEALLITVPEGFMQDEAALRAFTRDLGVALKGPEGAPLVQVRLADVDDTLYRLDDGAWVPDGRRPLGLGGF